MSASQPIVVVSAMADELAPLVGRLGNARRRRVGGLRTHHGSLSGREVVLAAAGEGPRLSARGVRRLLERQPARALLGIGVAGGLTGDLAARDLVWSREVRNEAGQSWEPPAWKWSERVSADGGPRGGSVIGMTQIVSDAGAKRELASRLAVEPPAVVDLESPEWAAAASERRLPWLVLRAVSDPVDQSMPLDFARFTGADGRVSRSRVIAHSMGRPRLWRELEALRRRVGECAVRLADATEELLAW